VAAPKPAAATQAASAPARLPTRNELPPELRAALPPISISGAVYAPRPADRLLFANGLVLKEGDALADGLTVERIGASSSVLAFRGQRFELKH
jgi:general secretion pathway protein B